MSEEGVDYYDSRPDRDEEEENSEEEGEPTYGRRNSDDDEDEEEEEDDEEEARQIAEGFIVDDEDEEDHDSDAEQQKVARRRKRKKIEDFEEELDEEDLDLLEENTGLKLSREPKLKRLKRGRQEEPEHSETAADKFFSDEELYEEAQDEQQVEEDQYATQYRRRQVYDDMDDFIAEEDDEEGLVDDRADLYNREAPRRGAAKDMMDILPEGLSEDVLADMYDIFGDGADYEWALEEEPAEYEEEQLEPKLADVFEPSELKARMLTEEDEEVRMRDIPERMQVRYAGTRKTFDIPPSDEEIQVEGTWVARELASVKNIDQPTEHFLNAVKHVVSFISREYLEVPYISDHRRDYFTEVDPDGVTTELLTHDDLWKIYDLDFKYTSFANRKAGLREYLSKCSIYDEYVSNLVDKAEKIEELNDISDYVNLRFADNVNSLQKQTKGPKRPANKSLYEISLRNKVSEFLPRFGITAAQYGANYLERSRRYYPEDALVSPEEEAATFVSTSFSDSGRVLRAARSVLSQDIAHDPQVRKAMRRDWEARAVVSVKPTDKGFDQIDDLHPMHPFKYVHDKPISSFTNGEYLLLMKGEEDGLLSVHVNIANYDGWFNQIAEYYMSDGYSDSAQQWNQQRQDVLQMALSEHLIPIMEKYSREKLRIEAQEAVCDASYQSLMSKVNVGAFRGPDADRYKNGIPRVIAVSSGNGERNDPVVAVFVNHRGRLADRLEVPTLRDEKYWKQMVEFVSSKKPNVIGVAGFTAQTRHVYKSMQTLLNDINNTDSSVPTIDLLAVDDEASRLYKNSKRARDEFGEFSEVTRYCISLARRLQCPILEYTGLDRDLLALRHHDLQNLVPEEMLLASLERALINVVNDLGIDINATASSPYLATALKYVCGLGPRKAQSILQKIDAKGELESRSALVTRGMTPAITFMNCASYLRIRNVDDADILDDTRIHPQEYDLARKMAGDALEIDEDEMDDYETKVMIVRRVVKEYPNKLNDLILDDYAVVLRTQYNAPKRQILEHIKLELQGPYHDRRQKYTRPTMDETFRMVSGETRDTLREGFILPVKIHSLRGKMAICQLDSGLDGYIYIDQASDNRIMSVADVLEHGSTINAKVLGIDRDKFAVTLSSKASDTKPNSDLSLRRQPNDHYYDSQAEAREIERRRAMRKKRTKTQRVINHPLFHQFNYMEAEEYLASRQRGDLVIRPSSRGPEHIAITWKVDEGVYQHIDVVEMRKDASVFAPVQYKIGEHIFDDLDQLIVTYVEAIAAKAEELIAHPKYRPGGATALKSHLSSLTMANPRISAYGFCLSDRPGYFELGFKLNAKSPAAQWAIKLLPDGYRLRDTSYPVVADLINGFKRIQANEAQQRRPRHGHNHGAHGYHGQRPPRH
ncbi:SH2 domain-containing protein [Zychaea mexicana]|uniref:SH2 domain-containing protein n=1 Tax=Zychaea mexicana TaxID=64656 RepID=UPI0022FE4DB6|nr:SH2 domain-containing protein [Zychaea mexicana]KAI9490605.1 SH2 domain-containing protein [Zychaea mexicana]